MLTIPAILFEPAQSLCIMFSALHWIASYIAKLIFRIMSVKMLSNPPVTLMFHAYHIADVLQLNQQWHYIISVIVYTT